MEETVKDDVGYIEMKFGPRWKYIAVVRSFIQNFLAVNASTLARADKIAMAVSELLENAVKYASGEETTVAVRLDRLSKSLTVSVANEASPEAVKGLKDNWDIAMQGEPLEAYIKRMQEAAVRTDSKSQLGLVRIRYETGADMKLDVQGNQVKITLVSELDE